MYVKQLSLGQQTRKVRIAQVLNNYCKDLKKICFTVQQGESKMRAS